MVARPIAYGSVCSGIEAASVAWKPLGWRCAFVSEIEPFPCAVLAHHHPDAPNLGDMTRITDAPAIDLLVGGTPCQSFSVAGLRAGMADPRGNLALVFLGLLGRTRARWVVWENVPGVLSSNGGRDFGAFLGGLAQLGYGFAYRVLDAQYFGVAQRRRRVFVVGHLGDWRRAAAVLFERSSLRGDLAPSREAGACVAGTVEARTCRSVGAEEAANGHLTVYPIQEVSKRESKDQNGVGIGIADGRDPMFTLQAGAQHGVAVTGVHSRQDPISEAGLSLPLEAKGGQAVRYSDLETLQHQGYDGAHARAQEADAQAILRVLQGQVGEEAFAEWRSGVLDSLQSPEVLRAALHGVGVRRAAREAGVLMGDRALARAQGVPEGAMRALWIDGPDGRSPQGRELAEQLARQLGASLPVLPHQVASGVRRLTPREAERLQGFPDDYTLIPYRGKPAKDAPRYRALGNSMAVPVMRWIGERIDAVEAIA